jgi:endoglucanase
VHPGTSLGDNAVGCYHPGFFQKCNGTWCRLKREELLMTHRLVVLLGLGMLLAATATAESENQADKPLDAFTANRLLGRGLNLGNALEAPQEGAWGLTLEADHFRQIKQAGFDSVRIPIRWSAHAPAESPYTLDPTFCKRVDWAIDQALANNLATVINVHHFEELYNDPDKHLPRFRAIWRQIAERYRDRPAQLFFELLNEPHGQLTGERWQLMIGQLLSVIRIPDQGRNWTRNILIGPGNWNNVHHLDQLQLPESDRYLIATFHYYLPFEFTHQGASWVSGSAKWKGTTWTGTPPQQQAVQNDFAKAAAWAKKQNRPLYLGEFGAYSAADMDSRARWTRAVAREAEKHGMSWAYWEFAAGFGVYDRNARAWRQPLLRALLDSQQ